MNAAVGLALGRMRRGGWGGELSAGGGGGGEKDGGEWEEEGVSVRGRGEQ